MQTPDTHAQRRGGRAGALAAAGAGLLVLAAAGGAWLLVAHPRPARLVQAVITVQASYAGEPPRPAAAVFYYAASEADLSPSSERFETARSGPGIGTARRAHPAGARVAFLVNPLGEDGAPEGRPVPWSFTWPETGGQALTLTILRAYPRPHGHASGSPAAATAAASGSPSVIHRPPAPITSGSSVICIDPGHPSEIADGLEVKNGTTETHCDWAVALRLRERLERDGFRVVMTKQAERETVANRRRADIANACGAAVMVRLHCDDGTRGRGFRVFYPDAPGRHEGVVGPSREVCAQSGAAARAIHDGLAAGLRGRLRDNGILTDRSTKVGGEYGALIGSIHSRVPTVTVEMVFLSDAGDAAFIKSDAGQQALADALADGIRLYVQAAAGQSVTPEQGTGSPR